MSITEINKTRSELIAWIGQLSDPNMLMVLDNLKSAKSNKDWWHNLSESQKLHINEGIDDVENGRTMSSEGFWNNLKNA